MRAGALLVARGGRHGNTFGCAVALDGTVVCVGGSVRGQLGIDPAISDASPTPQMPALTCP